VGKDEDSSDATKINQLMQEVRAGREEVQQLTAKMAKMSVSVAQHRSPTSERRQQRVSFQDPVSLPTARRYTASQPHTVVRGSWRTVNQNPSRQFGPSGTTIQLCDNCGRSHGLNRSQRLTLRVQGHSRSSNQIKSKARMRLPISD